MNGNGEALAEEEITKVIIGAFFRVYNKLGFGFLERPYVAAMQRELTNTGLHVGREVGVRLYYDGEVIGRYKLDMIVEERVVVEIKSGYELHGAAHRQLHSYLHATKLEVGLLLHFGPQPKFYRADHPNTKKCLSPDHKPNSPHP